jgi:hypothetical protein
VTTASPEFCNKQLSLLRSLVRMPKEMAGADMDLQLVGYMNALCRYDPRDVEAACRSWVEVKRSKFFPTLPDLLDEADEAKLKREHQQLAHAPARAHAGENFIQRCHRLGFGADRMSTIGSGAWKNIWERSEPDRERPARWVPLTDGHVLLALQWCEAHPGVTWKPIAHATPAEIRETMRLVLQMEANPAAYFAPATPSLIAIGREMIRRHIEAGRAPADVVEWFEPLPVAAE